MAKPSSVGGGRKKRPPPTTNVGPTAVLTVSPTSVIVGDTVTCSTSGTKAGTGALASWQLSYGDGSVTSGTGGPTTDLTHAYAAAGGYTPRLVVTDINGLGSSSTGQTVTVSVPQASGGRGPQTGVTAPAGAVTIAAGSTTTSRQTAINNNAAGTTFFLEAGTHTASGTNTPKTGNTFIGEYGAIIDGTGWSTSDADASPFTSIDGGITGVTIRNLQITTCPSYGVNSLFSSSGWWVDYCEIDHCTTGVSLGYGGKVTNCKIHHHTSGGYAFQNSTGAVFTNNEVNDNGTEQKFLENPTRSGTNTGLYIATNYFHDNTADGFWIDGNGAGSIVENNTVENNGRTGITLESAVSVVVRNNTVTDHAAGEGILLTISRNCTVSGNTLSGNIYGIGLFLDCDTLSPQFPWAQDLTNNTIQGNTITVPNVAAHYASLLSFLYPGTCKSAYVANTKQNKFIGNTYNVTGNGNWWFWDGSKPWADWQALPQDTAGTRNAS